MAASQPKEAHSLADLISLAEAPPRYFERPASSKKESLVLYISRVPGTQNIILSTLKPSKKNVGLEDVNSALYLVQPQLSSSHAVAPAPFPNDETGSTSDKSASPMTIPRKPLPENARPVTPDSACSSKLNLEASPVPNGRRRGASITSQDSSLRQTLPSSLATESYIPSLDTDERGRAQPQRIPPNMQTLPARKPHGPRAMIPPVAVTNSSPITAATGRFRSDSTASAMGEMFEPRFDCASSRSPSPRKRSVASVSSPGKPFALRVTRRDPSTGNQRDVAIITSWQPDPPAHKEEPGVSTSSPPINIYLNNSGYIMFRSPSNYQGVKADDHDPAKPDDFTIFLQLQMGHTKSFVANIKSRIQELGEQISKRGHARGNSDSSQELAKDQAASVAHRQPGPGKKPRGYTFTSPWEGQCDFRTGGGGDTLDCYHTFHDPNSSYQRLEDEGIDLSRLSAGHLSELRFDLPLTERMMHHEDGPIGHFSKFLRPAHENLDEEGAAVVLPFDINVGAEQAGGGKRGNRAKLGKLIIHDDGQQMLDMLVAANMGVWWRTWERSF